MNRLQLTIPARDRARAVKIRPRQVREWLDNLPYLDLVRAAGLASHQLRTMNRQPVSPATRLEILGDFLGAYHRLSESLPATGANVEATRPLLKRLCQDIGFGYKVAVHELANVKTGLLQGRSLSLALLGAVHTLGMQLTRCYATYQRAPRALWLECLTLYSFARDTGRHRYRCQLPGLGEAELDTRFRVLALLRLANPYRLAPGMAGAIERYLHLHIHRVTLQSGASANAEGIQVALTGPDHRVEGDPADTLVLDVTALTAQMVADIDKLQRHAQARAIGLAPELPAATLLHSLQQLRSDWASPRSRNRERETAHAPVELVAGLEAVYCVLNRGRGFDPGMFLAAAHEEVIDLGHRPAPEGRAAAVQASTIPCITTNHSSGGVALSHRGKARQQPRVGQLVALRRQAAGSSGAWIVAACRWLVAPETGDTGFDIGLEYMARNARPVVIRPLTASGTEGGHQPALLADQKRGRERVRTLIAHSDELSIGQSIVVYDHGSQYHLRCVETVDSGPGFERVICEPA